MFGQYDEKHHRGLFLESAGVMKLDGEGKLAVLFAYRNRHRYLMEALRWHEQQLDHQV